MTTVIARIDETANAVQSQRGIGLTGFFTALAVSGGIFAGQIALFVILRTRTAFRSIYQADCTLSTKPSIRDLRKWKEDDIIEKCGLDAYFFLRFLWMIVKLFLPILFVAMPALFVLNFVSGRSQDIEAKEATSQVIGLDTLAFGNVREENMARYIAHTIITIIIVAWFFRVLYQEMREYSRRRQDYFRTRSDCDSSNIVLLSSLPESLLEDGMAKLRESFGILPGGVKGVWRIHDITKLSSKIKERQTLADRYEIALTKLVRQEFRECQHMTPGHYAGSFRERVIGRQGMLSTENPKTKQYREKIDTLNNEIDLAEKESYLAMKMLVSDNPSFPCLAMDIISPDNIIWGNISMRWWARHLRSIGINVLLVVMILPWAIPVSWTAALSQVDVLIRNQPWLSFIQKNETLHRFCVAIAGILPSVALAALLYLLPLVLGFLARIKGTQLRTQQALFIQRFYFIFLFIQMVLVVSIASFFTNSLRQFLENLKELQSIGNILHLVSQNLPSAANYFFSYMALQAFGTSSGVVLEVWSLVRYLWESRVTYTAAQKWEWRETMTPMIWGSTYPFYTTMACIGLVYCVIAPLISVFVVLSFSLMWTTQKYAICFTRKFSMDTGGAFFLTAINQLFVGIYVMILCLAGLFFSASEREDQFRCMPLGVLMLILFLVVLCGQIMLNRHFSRLIHHPALVDDEINRLTASDMGGLSLSHDWAPVLRMSCCMLGYCTEGRHTNPTKIWVPKPLRNGLAEIEYNKARKSMNIHFKSSVAAATDTSEPLHRTAFYNSKARLQICTNAGSCEFHNIDTKGYPKEPGEKRPRRSTYRAYCSRTVRQCAAFMCRLLSGLKSTDNDTGATACEKDTPVALCNPPNN